MIRVRKCLKFSWLSQKYVVILSAHKMCSTDRSSSSACSCSCWKIYLSSLHGILTMYKHQHLSMVFWQCTKINIHPWYSDKVQRSTFIHGTLIMYCRRHENVCPISGSKQACLLTKTHVTEGLPSKVRDLIGSVQIPNQVSSHHQDITHIFKQSVTLSADLRSTIE